MEVGRKKFGRPKEIWSTKDKFVDEKSFSTKKSGRPKKFSAKEKMVDERIANR